MAFCYVMLVYSELCSYFFVINRKYDYRVKVYTFKINIIIVDLEYID